MKKLGILMLAMLLVCGMSLGVMAKLAEDEIDINANVAEKATIETDGSINLNINDFEATESDQNADVIVRANTDVYVTFAENLSRKLADRLPRNNMVWAFDDSNLDEVRGLLTGDNWIVSPNVTIDKFNWDASKGLMHTHKDGMAKVINVSSGYHKFEVGMATTWRELDSNGDMLAWYDLNAEDNITATVTVTVDAGAFDYFN